MLNLVGKKKKIQEAIQPPQPQVLPLLGLMRMDIPLVRDAHPLAIMTPLGVVPINRFMVNKMDEELKKLEVAKPTDEHDKVYFS